MLSRAAHRSAFGRHGARRAASHAALPCSCSFQAPSQIGWRTARLLTTSTTTTHNPSTFMNFSIRPTKSILSPTGRQSSIPLRTSSYAYFSSRPSRQRFPERLDQSSIIANTRKFESRSFRITFGNQIRAKATNSKSPENSKAAEQGSASKSTSSPEASKSSETFRSTPPPPPPPSTNESPFSSHNLFNRLPHVSFHSPTKDELLAAATGFWSRLRVRFKWFSIRSLRPFNIDDISAFATWIIAGHFLWILVGTTTFVSILIFAVNTVFAQETLAGWVGNYLTKSSGVRVVFESAIVPKWKGGVISFKNVFVSRRPGQKQTKVRKGSQAVAAAAAEAESAENAVGSEDEDTNFTQFDLSIETINVTLSFVRWFNGKGLLRDVEMKGVRGVVDRTSVHWDGVNEDPRAYLHEHSTGDFELESFKLEDLLVSVYQPHDFRPFSVSIFSADLPQLRKQWLFYDMLSANHMSGSFDDSLFTIHPRQTHSVTGAALQQADSTEWKKHSRIRIDGLNIDHLNRGVEGPFSWIHEGNVDIVADIMFPADGEESIAKVMSDFYDRMEATVSSNRMLYHNQRQTEEVSADSPAQSNAKPVHSQQSTVTSSEDVDPNSTRYLVMDLRVHLNDVHASVPLFTRDLSYVNNALIRPIVAYINSRKEFIPVNCRVVKTLREFDGSWTIYDSALMDDLSRETYDAFARDVVDDQQRMRRIKKVGMWSLQLAIQALFLGLAGNVA